MGGVADSPSSHPPAPVRSAGAGIVTTRWTLVFDAARTGTPQSRRALEALCGQYWYPLYAFVRQQGYGADDAGDLTQEFFLRLLARNDFAAADPSRGRFRSYLLGALRHFLSDQRDRRAALKRGGDRPTSPVGPAGLEGCADWPGAERRYAAEPAHDLTPQALFDRRWAMALLGEVLRLLKAEMQGQGRGDLFQALKESIGGGDDGRPYRELAASMGMSEGAVKVAVHRLRRRYRELLRQQIARTVADPEEVDDEIRDLFAALG
jgi:RNA polymerase sigma-70 factor (ECF subfamily)